MAEKKLHELTDINRRTFYPRQNMNMASDFDPGYKYAN